MGFPSGLPSKFWANRRELPSPIAFRCRDRSVYGFAFDVLPLFPVDGLIAFSESFIYSFKTWCTFCWEEGCRTVKIPAVDWCSLQIFFSVIQDDEGFDLAAWCVTWIRPGFGAFWTPIACIV